MPATSTLRSTALLTTVSLISQALGFLYRIALSRLIGAESMGLFQLIMPVYSLLLSATAVGLTAAVSTLSARRLALGDRGGAKALVDHCVGLFLLLGGALGTLVALGSDFISVHLVGDARTQLGLILLAPCLLLTGVENLHKHFFYGTGNPRAPALLELCEQFIRVGAVLSLLLCFPPSNPERAVGLILCGMVVCEVFSALTLSLLFRRFLAGVPPRREPGLGRAVAAVALPVGGTALLNNLLGSADSILIPRLLTAGGMPVPEAMRAFGVLFGMTAPLLCLPTALIGAMGLVLTPRLAQLSALGRQLQARRTLEHSLEAAALLLLPTVGWLAAVGPELGQFLFHDPAVGSHMVPLAVGVVLNARQSMLSCALNGLGRQRDAARAALAGGAVQLLFTVATVKSFGLNGYMIGYLVSSAAALWLNQRAVDRALAAPRPPLLPQFSPALAALLMALNVRLLFRLLLLRGMALLPAAGACALFGAVLYLAALHAQGIRPPRLRR